MNWRTTLPGALWVAASLVADPPQYGIQSLNGNVLSTSNRGEFHLQMVFPQWAAIDLFLLKWPSNLLESSIAVASGGKMVWTPVFTIENITRSSQIEAYMVEPPSSGLTVQSVNIALGEVTLSDSSVSAVLPSELAQVGSSQMGEVVLVGVSELCCAPYTLFLFNTALYSLVWAAEVL